MSRYKNHVTFYLENNNDFKVKVVVAVYYYGGDHSKKVSDCHTYEIPARTDEHKKHRIDHWAGKYVNDVDEKLVDIWLEHCYEVR